MKEVKPEQVNEISGGTIPGSVGELLERGYWPDNPFGTPPYNPGGPTAPETSLVS